MDINTDAPVITRDEILISAPIQTIWDIQTDVAGWPSWQPDVDGAEADGPLTVGSVFRWHTAGLDITSTVEEVDARAPDRIERSRVRDRRHSRLDSRRTRRRSSRPNRRVVGGRSGRRPARGAASRAGRLAA